MNYLYLECSIEHFWTEADHGLLKPREEGKANCIREASSSLQTPGFVQILPPLCPWRQSSLVLVLVARLKMVGLYIISSLVCDRFHGPQAGLQILYPPASHSRMLGQTKESEMAQEVKVRVPKPDDLSHPPNPPTERRTTSHKQAHTRLLHKQAHTRLNKQVQGTGE